MTMIYRSLDPSDFTDKRLSEPLVQRVIDRTRHVPDSPVLTLILKDGTKITEPIQPHTNLKGWDTVSEKFQKSVAGCLSSMTARIVGVGFSPGQAPVSSGTGAKSLCRLASTELSAYFSHNSRTTGFMIWTRSLTK